jgi:uncharacterized membrane protein (UPF0127 family)
MDGLGAMEVLHLRLPDGGTVACFVAERRRRRLVGLAGAHGLPPGSGLLLPRCRSVHTFGMRFAIDVLFVTLERDDLLRVHDERRGVGPCRVVWAARGARRQPRLAALELPAPFWC